MAKSIDLQTEHGCGMSYEKHLGIIEAVVQEEKNLFSRSFLYRMFEIKSDERPEPFLLERWIRLAPKRSDIGCGNALKKFVQTLLDMAESMQTNDKVRPVFAPAMSRVLCVPQKKIIAHLQSYDAIRGMI